MQRSYSVEREVIRVLHKRFRSKLDLSLLLEGRIDFDPKRDYESVTAFASDYFLCSFLKKWKGHGASSMAKATAIRAWISAERQCFETNLRLDRDCVRFPPNVLDLIPKIQHKIISVIGLQPDLGSISAHCRFGPGATFDIRRGATVPGKMKSELTVTNRAHKWAERLIFPDPYWVEVVGTDYKIVRGNRLITVPKTFKTDRTIAAEPTLNGFLQQGVGRFLRSRLKVNGIDLDDQTINQSRAGQAYLDGLSTLDLSMASDTMSHSLVRLLLPSLWFELLDDLRSPISSADGRNWILSKFSSMGNAFTFELESLIFWAICSACEDGEQCAPSTVYGDDLIVDRKIYSKVVHALEYFGFTVNIEKSYRDGSFFESCGKHFFFGSEVTPAYQKEVCTSVFELIRMHNRIFLWGRRTGLPVRDALNFIRNYTRDTFHFALLGPPCEGDPWFFEPKVVFADGSKQFAYVRKQSRRRASSLDEFLCLGYKLRRSETLNQHPRGYCFFDSATRDTIARITFWISRTL